MPALANITIKKANGTTDIVYTGKSPSAGDGVPAIWRSDTVGFAVAHQPEFRLTAREASKGLKRAMRVTYVYPQIATNSTTGVTSVIDKAMASADVTLPKGMATADVAEFAYQWANLVASSLIKQCLADGVSAT
jgi:hypothetical protein